MGLPYSRQIHFAFDQVTPLVAYGFRVLETSRDIAVLVALIQVLTCLLLGANLLALLALLISVNPDLELERQAIVTPALRWLASWVRNPEDRKWLEFVGFVVLGGIAFGAWAGCYVMQDPALILPHESASDEMVEEAVEGQEQ